MPPAHITSLHNPRVKQAARLREHRERASRGETLVDGVREIGRALAAGWRVRELLVAEPLAGDPEAAALLAEVERRGGECLVLSPAVYEKVAYGERQVGAVAVVAVPQRRLAELILPADRPPLVVVVEGIEKPGNLGAILRSADATGVDAVIVCGGGTDLYNPNVIRASVGTIFTVRVVQAEAAEALVWLQARELAIAAAIVGGSEAYADFDFRRPTAIVLGSEAAGLTQLWQKAEVARLSLPMLGAADSLNVSVTAAVLCYEAWRQRRPRPGNAT